MFDYHNNDGYLENKFLQNRMKDIKITAGTDTGEIAIFSIKRSKLAFLKYANQSSSDKFFEWLYYSVNLLWDLEGWDDTKK